MLTRAEQKVTVHYSGPEVLALTLSISAKFVCISLRYSFMHSVVNCFRVLTF